LSKLARIPDLHLEELVLVGCRDVGNEGISQLCLHQKQLKHLDISGCLDVTDIALKNIATYLTSLDTLRVNKCRMLTDDSMGQLKNMGHLHTLDISECYEVWGRGGGF
jgi:hypothetical protein